MSGPYFAVYFGVGHKLEADWFSKLENRSQWVVDQVREQMAKEPDFLRQQLEEYENEVKRLKAALESPDLHRRMEELERQTSRSSPVDITPELARRLLEMSEPPADPNEVLLWSLFQHSREGLEGLKGLVTGPAWKESVKRLGYTNPVLLAEDVYGAAKALEAEARPSEPKSGGE